MGKSEAPAVGIAEESNRGDIRESSGPELNLGVVLRAPACYVEDHFGREKRDELIRAVGLEPTHFDGKSYWGTLKHAEDFQALVFDLIGRDEKKFADVAGYKLARSFGPVRYLLKARSPSFVYEKMINTFHVVCSFSHKELIEMTEQSCSFRYKTTKAESRLQCLSRQGTVMAMPTIWGLPKAQISETSCVSRGDDCCEYHLRWFRPQRRSLPLLGAVLGIALFFVGLLFQPTWAAYFTAPALLLPLLGYLYEVWKSNSANLKLSNEMTDEMRALAEEDALVRKEILQLNERQREWDQVVTKRGAEGMAERQILVERLEELQEQLQTNIRGLSHDIRTPLAVLKTHNVILQMQGEKIEKAEFEEILSLQDDAINKITVLVAEMMKVAKDKKPLKTVTSQPIDVGNLFEQLKRRIKALAHGRDISTEVRMADSAPEQIETDQLMFDRIIDNLLINAAKYTAQGQITIMLSGNNGTFAIEIKDTGRGIAREDIPRIFTPGGSDVATRQTDSYGIGLSVVLLLLAQLGGRLEIESEPGLGSLFRVVLPKTYKKTDCEEGDISNLTSASLFQRVVSVVPPASYN